MSAPVLAFRNPATPARTQNARAAAYAQLPAVMQDAIAAVVQYQLDEQNYAPAGMEEAFVLIKEAADVLADREYDGDDEAA